MRAKRRSAMQRHRAEVMQQVAGRRLREARLVAGYTQALCAGRAGLTPQGWSKLELGQIDAGLGTWAAAAEAVKLNPRRLFEAALSGAKALEAFSQFWEVANFVKDRK